MNSLGCKLKDLRKSHNLTMEQLADKINTKYDTKINKGMLSKWENNLGEPSLENMRVLSNFYDVSLDYLLNIEKELSNKETSITDKEKKLLTNYNKLNDNGKKKLIEYSNDLIGNQRYSLSYDIRNGQIPLFDEIEEEKDYLKPVAAHNDNQNDGEQQQLIKNDLARLRAKKNTRNK